jgi:hypothetical protein
MIRAMRTWKGLEEDFRALSVYEDAKLHHQVDDEGERWSLSGPTHNIGIFESLAAIAGAKVRGLPAAADWPEVIQERGPGTRWYLCLKRHYPGDFEGGDITITGPDGVKRGSVAKLNRAFAMSSALCVKMDSLDVAPRLRLEVLCGVPRYAGPCQHWRAAQAFLGAAEIDFAQAAHEAASAVEGLARIVLGDLKITLGDATKELKMKRGLHPTISNAIDRVYAYTGDVGGIRHGAATPVQVKPAEARFAIDVCEAALLLLLALDAGE